MWHRRTVWEYNIPIYNHIIYYYQNPKTYVGWCGSARKCSSVSLGRFFNLWSVSLAVE